MGRIEKALRRSGRSDDAGESAARREAFVSPWTVTVPAARESGKTDPSHRESAGFFGKATAIPGGELTSSRPDLLAVSDTADPHLSSQFRRLAATLHNAQRHENLKLVLVTSAVPGDGKTVTALNVALTLSRSYLRRVLLIDADLRRPSVQTYWDIPGVRGLSDGLRSADDQTLSTYQIGKTLTVLPAGRPDPDPTSGLTSARMHRILEEAKERFDWVVLDSPPISFADDATLLAQMVQAVVFVVRAGKTPYQVVGRCVEALGRERIFGVVLNGVERKNSSGNDYYGYGHYFPPQQASTEKEPQR